MEQINKYLIIRFEPSIYRTRRDEIVANFAKEINFLRIGTKYKQITPKEVALRLNANPSFKGRDGEAELLLKTCVEKRSFSKFFWSCPLPITRYEK